MSLRLENFILCTRASKRTRYRNDVDDDGPFSKDLLHVAYRKKVLRISGIRKGKKKG